MKIFLIGGPGHHFNNVKLSLNRLGISYSYANYWPTFRLHTWDKKEETDFLFNSWVKLIYFFHYRLFRFVRKFNKQDEQIISMYAKLVASKVDREEYNLIWAFQMAALELFKKKESDRNINLLDYGMIHIDEYMRMMDKEYEQYHYTGYRNSYFSASFVERIKEEYELADKILVLSAYAKETMIKGGVHPDKLVLLPLFVDHNFYLPAARETQSTDPIKILFVGRIEYLKGVQYLLKAFQLLENASLTLVGHSSEETKSILASHLSDHRITVLPGKSKEELLAIYQSHDVLVLPSIQESFGLVILEAMSCGLAVVASRHSGGPDIIETGIDGLLVDPQHSDQLLEALNTLSNDRDLLKKIQQKARVKMESHYSITQYEEQVKNLLENLCR